MPIHFFLRLTALAVVTAFECHGVVAYDPKVNDPMVEPWRWKHVNVLDDLGVICMEEGDGGRVWFGGAKGVAVYDGKSVQSIPFGEDFASELTPRHGAFWVQSLLALEGDHFLALAGQSLVSWSEGQWSLVVANVGPVGFEALLRRGPNGWIWLFTRDRLWRVGPMLDQAELVLSAPEGSEWNAFCVDQAGNAWFLDRRLDVPIRLVTVPLDNGTPADESRWRVFYPEGRKSGNISSLLAASDGSIWYANNSDESGVQRLDPITGEWSDTAASGGEANFCSLLQTRDGTLWAAGYGDILAVGGDRSSYYRLRESGLPAFRITQMLETSDHSLWVGARLGQVYVVDRSHRQWLTYLDLHYQCETADGVLWFLGLGGRVIANDPSEGSWLAYDRDDGMIAVPVGVFATSQDLVWVVGSHRGRAAFAVFDGSRWTRTELPNFGRRIKVIFEASDHTIWMGAAGAKLKEVKGAGGALQFEVGPDGNPRLIEHHSPPGFPYHINAFAETPDRTLWLGRPGLHFLRPGQSEATPVEDLPGVANDFIVVDSEGALWVAQQNYGVHRKHGAEWKNFTTKDGLAGDTVSGLLPLLDQSMLAMSDRGISRFDGTSWVGPVFPKAFSISSSNFGSMHQTRDGGIWFNYDTRFTTFDLSNQSPSISIRYLPDDREPETWLREGLEEVSQPGNVHIAWDGRDYRENTPREQLQFSYRLDDNDWSPYSFVRQHTFLNLPGGEHKLEVRSRDRDCNVDSSPAVFVFRVEPPLWMKPWFIGMNVLLLGGGAALVWQFLYFHDKAFKDRQRHLVELDEQKTRFFTNVSHELNTPLTSIIVPLRRMQKNETDPAARTMLDLIVRNVERMATLVRQLLDLRKVENGETGLALVSGNVAKHIRETVGLLEPMAVSRGVSCSLIGPESIAGWFDPDKLTSIVQNLVSNAIKYTPEGGAVRIEVSAAARIGKPVVSLVIEDTGRGIAPEQLEHIFQRFYRVPEKTIIEGSGIGLHLTHELVSLWGGSLVAESPVNPGSRHPGCRFRVELPIGEQALPSR